MVLIFVIKNRKGDLKMVKQDKELVCSDCGNAFIFTVGEQEFYEEKEFLEPKRCKYCRDARKAEKNMRTR